MSGLHEIGEPAELPDDDIAALVARHAALAASNGQRLQRQAQLGNQVQVNIAWVAITAIVELLAAAGVPIRIEQVAVRTEEIVAATLDDLEARSQLVIPGGPVNLSAFGTS